MSVETLLPSLNRRIVGIEETGIVRVAQHGWGKEGLIPLWFGEGDLPTPEFISRAASDALLGGETFYTHQRGIDPVREALAAYMNRTFGTDLDESRVTLTGSGMAALDLVMRVMTEPDDEVVVVGPVWPNIYSVVESNGAVVRHATHSLGAEGWSISVEEILAAVTDKTKAIFINSPGNPSGWLMEGEDQRRLMEAARARGIWIVADEVYHQLVYDRPVAPSFLQVAKPDDRLFVINSFSKSWLMTGWRLGWITHPSGLGDLLAKMVQITTSGSPQFLQRGAVEALTKGDSVIADLRERCKRGRDIVFDRLEAWPEVDAARPKAAFYAFFRVNGADDSVALAKEIIDRCNVGLAPGEAFGPGGQGCLRLCFASKPETLERAMDALDSVLGQGARQ